MVVGDAAIQNAEPVEKCELAGRDEQRPVVVSRGKLKAAFSRRQVVRRSPASDDAPWRLERFNDERHSRSGDDTLIEISTKRSAAR